VIHVFDHIGLPFEWALLTTVHPSGRSCINPRRVIIPLYLIAHTYSSAPNHLPSTKAETFLPAVIIGYYLPTALIYHPYENVEMPEL
jgi:hypothetical protein